MTDPDWTTVNQESVWTFRDRFLWKTTDRYWVQNDGGEMFIREQRHRLIPWRTRRQYITYDDQEVTA